MNKKTKRYHKNIFFPEWTDRSLLEFSNGIFNKKSLVFSVHSVMKIVGYSFEFGKQLFKYLLKSLNKTSINPDSLFEFYSSGEEIKKACFRFSHSGFPVDIVLVISADGTVITVYVTNKGDNHKTLNTKLYERS